MPLILHYKFHSDQMYTSAFNWQHQGLNWMDLYLFRRRQFQKSKFHALHCVIYVVYDACCQWSIYELNTKNLQKSNCYQINIIYLDKMLLFFLNYNILFPIFHLTSHHISNYFDEYSCFNLEPVIDYKYSQTMRSYFLLTIGIHLALINYFPIWSRLWPPVSWARRNIINKERATSPSGGRGRCLNG